MAPFKFIICLNGCLAPGTLSEEILSRFFLAGGGRVCRKGMSEGMSRVCRKVCRKGVVEGASEGYVGRYVGAMVQRYVGQVCRKGLSEGLSGGYVGEWLWVTVEPPPQGTIQGNIKSGTRPYIYIYIHTRFA